MTAFGEPTLAAEMLHRVTRFEKAKGSCHNDPIDNEPGGTAMETSSVCSDSNNVTAIGMPGLRVDALQGFAAVGTDASDLHEVETIPVEDELRPLYT